MQMWTTKNTDSFKKKNSGIEDSSEKESGKKQTRSSGKSQVSTTNVRICSELLVTVTVLTLMTEKKKNFWVKNFFFYGKLSLLCVWAQNLCDTSQNKDICPRTLWRRPNNPNVHFKISIKKNVFTDVPLKTDVNNPVRGRAVREDVKTTRVCWRRCVSCCLRLSSLCRHSCLGHIGLRSLVSLISNKMAALTFSYTLQLTVSTNRQWLQTWPR